MSARAGYTDTDGIISAQAVLHASTEYSPSAPSSPETLKNGADGYKSETSSLYGVRAAGPLADGEPVGRSAGRAILEGLGIWKKSKIDDLDAVATRPSVFDTPLGSHYSPISSYENNAAFDPSFRWTHREERKAIRKVDYKIFVWICLMFFALDIDRNNLANATADNLLNDVGLTQADYNLGNTLSKLAFLLAELPSQVIGKRLGVDVWLPTQMCIFSVMAAAQFGMKSRTSFLALRFLGPLAQGGFIPDVILYLSYYYTKYDLPLRLAFFYSINYISATATAFLAVGILRLRGSLGYAGWQWMFLIEGLFTLTVGILSYFFLPPGPSETKARWRPNGYFTDHEVKIIVNRVLRDDPAKGGMHNRQALTAKLLWKSLLDYDLWPIYLIGFTFGMPGTPVSAYFQLSMKKLGFSTVKANLLAVPNTVISCITLASITVLSELVDSRTWVASLENWWFLPFFIALKVIDRPGSWTYFALSTLLLGFPYAHVIQVSWASRNSGSVRTRTFSASVYNVACQVSAMAGAYLYQADDSPPYYPRGNSIILGIIAWNLLVAYPLAYVYYNKRNAWKESKWSVMTTEEQANYLETTSDEGAKRLDFRFAY